MELKKMREMTEVELNAELDNMKKELFISTTWIIMHRRNTTVI